MDLQHWQAQFENWLKNHHQHQDAAHDVCHFRRVWATAQKLAADDDVDMLVILTACYFHDIVGNDSNLLIVFYVQIMPDDFVMQLHRF